MRHQPDDANFSALVIGGGDDISPDHFGEDLENIIKHDPARDDLEIKWINSALEHNIPLLGICRGAQLINVVLGGKLYSDIRNMRNMTYNRPGLLPTKQVHLEAGSLMAKICGKTHLRVNSLHHQAVKSPGENLVVTGRDLDEIPQAVEHSAGKNVIGVQWHPEYLLYLPAQLALFRWLVCGGCE